MSTLMKVALFLPALFSVGAAADVKETTVAINLNSTTASCNIAEYILALQDDCGYISIHGLWPDPEDSCTDCTSEEFNESEITSSVLADMNAYWPTCQSGENSDFWSHEWSKHGTCTGMSQNDYFAEGISLYKSYKGECTSDCYVCFTPSFGYEGVC